jgi:hypothetical protein
MTEHIGIPALQSVGNKALDEIIELKEQLQAAEARAVAAETALTSICTIYECWRVMDHTQRQTNDRMRAIGKIADAVDLTAARELIAKADSFDDIYEALPDDSPAKFPETGVSVLDEVKDLIQHKV